MDGFRWFEECDDSNPLIHPNADEIWNAIDDDCDEEIDEGINRVDFISRTPARNEVLVNATFDALELSISIDIPESDIGNLNVSIS